MPDITTELDDAELRECCFDDALDREDETDWDALDPDELRQMADSLLAVFPEPDRRLCELLSGTSPASQRWLLRLEHLRTVLLRRQLAPVVVMIRALPAMRSEAAYSRSRGKLGRHRDAEVDRRDARSGRTWGVHRGIGTSLAWTASDIPDLPLLSNRAPACAPLCATPARGGAR
jgi:hypothetical protein